MNSGLVHIYLLIVVCTCFTQRYWVRHFHNSRHVFRCLPSCSSGTPSHPVLYRSLPADEREFSNGSLRLFMTLHLFARPRVPCDPEDRIPSSYTDCIPQHKVSVGEWRDKYCLTTLKQKMCDFANTFDCKHIMFHRVKWNLMETKRLSSTPGDGCVVRSENPTWKWSLNLGSASFFQSNNCLHTRIVCLNF